MEEDERGIKDPEPPDCSSSMKEWEQSILKIQYMTLYKLVRMVVQNPIQYRI